MLPAHGRPRLQRRKLIAGGTSLAIAVIAGVALWCRAAPASSSRPAAASGQVPAVETAPFAGAIDALTAAPEVHYLATVPGMGTVNVKVTNFGQLIGDIEDDGDSVQLLQVGGKLYVKPGAAGLPGVISQGETQRLRASG